MDPFTNEPYAFDDQGSSADPREADFNNGIREITILMLAGCVLYAGAFRVLTSLKKSEQEEDDFLPVSWEDSIVYQISFGICAFSMAVSAGSVLLLPISSISNEILHHYPSSWYIQWLNASLIHGIWNLIFVLSNASLFLALPFAYLFCESEGLPFFGNKRGLVARAKETILTLILLSFVIMGLMYILAALIDWDRDSFDRLINVYSYLPFLYSCVSFMGVIMLLICTPLGFARLFTIVGDLVIKPNWARNLDEEYYSAKFEEDNLNTKIANCKLCSNYILLTPISSPEGRILRNGEILAYYETTRNEVRDKRQNLDKARQTSMWRRVLGYPLIMLSLLLLTGLSLLCVVMNVAQIVAGFRSLPIYQTAVEEFGITSLSSFGAIGVFIEVVLIGYLFVTSLVGLYTIPVITRIRPMLSSTPLTHLILNCCIYVILSTALPLLAKILGITNFDLLGKFSEVKWLGNFYLVLLYNAIFAVAASLCIFKNFTDRVRKEIVRRVQIYISTIFASKKNYSYSSNNASSSAANRLGAITPTSTGLKTE